MCGGTVAPGEDLGQLRGLSPRVRGNPIPASAAAALARSIPACAGEPGRDAGMVWASEVYPRVCGGTRRLRNGCGVGQGLSPRVRGNPRAAAADAALRWSIPACAGEPVSRLNCDTILAVYPRVCGGTYRRRQSGPAAKGLSPRVRGNRLTSAGASRSGGSIPACAGEPGTGSGADAVAMVYPRVCGGTRNRGSVPRLIAGLSPRVRGNQRRASARPCRSGSIPACAGEPATAVVCAGSATVYPRVCGEPPSG